MKKRVFGIVLILVVVIVATVGLTSCINRMDNYFSVVPTDTDYIATLYYRNQNSLGDYTKNWKVIRKSASIVGEMRTVIYVEFAYEDLIEHYGDYSRKLLYVNGKVLGVNSEGTAWEPYTGSFGDKWSDIYGSMSAPESFVYEMTQKINGRDFPVKYKKETSDYIQYDFERDNEVFRISPDIYHLLLYYTFDYGETHSRHEATFVLGTPSDSIPFTDTITAEMIANSES